MSPLWILISVVLVLQTIRACDENHEDQMVRQDAMDYWANAYGFTSNPWNSPWNSLYYQPTRVEENNDPYEVLGRTRTPQKQQSRDNPLSNLFSKNNVDSNQLEGRFGLGLGSSILNAGFFNNRFTSTGSASRPFAGLSNLLPISLNPNYAGPLSTFDSCTSPSGEAGICSPGSVCSLFGGRPSGSCLLGGVCCINAVTTCGGTITVNNTYWQSPSTLSSPSSCALTVKLNTKFVEQKKPICQVRLDFISFSIAQPTGATGTCTDTFQVAGSTNTAPQICGDNNGQHMYLEVPSSAITTTSLQLMFNFATGTTATTRSWNIKISMLPCGASYLAPSDCLQYFTSMSGTVSAFNWKDSVTARQLNNQNYNICFRNELVNSQKASTFCVTPCTVTVAANSAFIVSTETAGSSTAAGGCLLDYLIFVGGTSAAVPADRYCGERLNSAVAATATSVTSLCSTFKPFRLVYKTDGSETAIETAANNNVGFCLTFSQS